MLKIIRVTIAGLFFACITALFLDFTGTKHAWLGWMAKIQFLPGLKNLPVLRVPKLRQASHCIGCKQCISSLSARNRYLR